MNLFKNPGGSARNAQLSPPRDADEKPQHRQAEEEENLCVDGRAKGKKSQISFVCGCGSTANDVASPFLIFFIDCLNFKNYNYKKIYIPHSNLKKIRQLIK